MNVRTGACDRPSIRSIHEKAQHAAVALGRYQFDHPNQTLLLGGRTKRLTERENELLKLLCRHRGQLVRRDEVLKTLWGRTDYFNGRSLDVFITKLRKYLSDDPAVQIETIHRTGFILTLTDQDSQDLRIGRIAD